MSLNDTIKNAVKQAFSVVDDLAVDIVVSRESDATYDPATGDVTGAILEMPLRAIRNELSAFEKEKLKIETEGLKFLLELDSVPQLPTVNDTLIYNEVVYKIVSIDRDVSDNLLKLVVGL